MRRCKRCQNPLTFAGVLVGGKLAFTCTATLYRTDRVDGVLRNVPVPCNPREDCVGEDGMLLARPIPWAPRHPKTGEVMLSGAPANRKALRRIATTHGAPADLGLRKMAAAATLATRKLADAARATQQLTKRAVA